MKKPNKSKKPAAAPKAASVPVEIRCYPHVIHVHVDGQEVPALRARHDQVQAVRASMEKNPAHVITVQKYDAQGNKVA